VQHLGEVRCDETAHPRPHSLRSTSTGSTSNTRRAGR
jgi:hypothetical protein